MSISEKESGRQLAFLKKCNARHCCCACKYPSISYSKENEGMLIHRQFGVKVKIGKSTWLKGADVNVQYHSCINATKSKEAGEKNKFIFSGVRFPSLMLHPSYITNSAHGEMGKMWKYLRRCGDVFWGKVAQVRTSAWYTAAHKYRNMIHLKKKTTTTPPGYFRERSENDIPSADCRSA